MAIKGIFCVHAYVSDLARAKRFYGETLGWKLGTDEAVVAGMHVAVRVDDLDAQHAHLAQRGVAVTPIEARPWGERNFSFTDPDGYLWEYGQPRG